MNPLQAQHIYCIGIGGIGVSALAKFFLARGVEVTGTDVVIGEEVKALTGRGVRISVGEGKLPENVDLIVYSSAATPEQHPEMKEAEAQGIPMYSYTEILGLLMKEHTSVAVSGTNGKTTTTAILGKILERADLEPTVIVGGHVPGWDRNLRIGASDLFIAEGCEYKRNILNLHPKMIVLTNVTEDHLDTYKDLDDIIATFQTYVSRLPHDGVLIYNHDDPGARRVSEAAPCRTVSFGFAPGADVIIRRDGIGYGKQYFTLLGPYLKGTFTTYIPGLFNLANIAAASIAAHELGAPNTAIQKTLEVFAGTWRRFEVLGVIDNTTIISDYGHHPQAVAFTIQAAKELYADKKVLIVFQPHQRDRTIKLFDGFVGAFDRADEVIFAEIYEVKGRNDAGNEISSRDLVRAIIERNPALAVTYVEHLGDIIPAVQERWHAFGAVIFMGAGDIDAVARSFVAAVSRQEVPVA